MHLFATTTPEQALELGKAAAAHEVVKPAGSGKTRRVSRVRSG